MERLNGFPDNWTEIGDIPNSLGIFLWVMLWWLD